MPDAREKISVLTAALDRACRSLGFRDYMPDPMIGHFVKQVVAVSLKYDRLDTSQFYQWVRQEYSVPDHVFSRVFSRLIDEASELGVRVVLPQGFDPSFDEVIKEYLRYDHDREGAGAEAGEKKEAPEEERPGGRSMPVATVVRTPADADVIEDADEQIITELDSPESHEDEEPALPVPVVTSPAAEATAATPAPTAAQTQAQADISMEEIRRHVEARLKDSVEKELRANLWPVVYEEVREQLRRELRPEVAAQLRGEMKGEVEEELRTGLEARMREELLPALQEQLAAEVAAVEGERIRSEIEASCRDEVRDKLRKEMWDEVREEVRSDLRTVLTPVLEAEMKKELQESAPPPPPPAAEAPLPPEAMPVLAGLGAQVQLDLIKRIRTELEPRLRAAFAADLEAMALVREEEERRQDLESRMADPEYCLDKIRAFLFAEQPALWAKVKPFIVVGQWSTVVRFLETGGPEIDPALLERTRGVIREALIIKAEIEEEINYTPAIKGIEEAREGARSIRKTLAGAEQVLDFALQSIASLLEQPAP